VRDLAFGAPHIGGMSSSPPTALVTGANRGLGLETARQLVARGFHVLPASRDAHVREAAAAHVGASVAQGEPWMLDVTDAGSIAALAARLEREGMRLDVLVNNAGISLEGFDVQVVHRTLAVNFSGAIAVTDALLPSMRDGGAIVMVSSGMGELSAFAPPLRARFLDAHLTRAELIDLVRSFEQAVGEGRHVAEGWPSSAYRVSKAGLNAVVRMLARKLAPRRIRVNAVCPGWVRTDMGGDAAPRPVEVGAASIVWAATHDDGGGQPTGGFFRDGRAISW
jgi:NAD(P)-dependent dehydrogenase (short-subunit alcohol dehydrogenase family)